MRSGTEIGKMMAKSEKGDEAKMGEDARGSDDQARLWEIEREMDEAWISEMGCCVKNYRSRMIFFFCVYTKCEVMLL